MTLWALLACHTTLHATVPTSPESCAACHEQLHTVWMGSMHRRAYDNEAFQASQDTVAEHQRSSFASMPCGSCHGRGWSSCIPRPGPERGGWAARAHPSGWHQVDGERADRLFWDGVHGTFPAPAQGWVVASHELEGHLRTLLHRLVLEGREVDEAVAAWMPTVQGAPWVRVELYPRDQVDRIAPVQVEPTPDTFIRVLVELTGLTEPHPIEEPMLPQMPVRGPLTVVEWGFVDR